MKDIFDIVKDEIVDNKSNNENKLEYVIEIAKENKIIKYSVFLTEKQANDLDNLINSIYSKLNNSKSSDNTKNIFYRNLVLLYTTNKIRLKKVCNKKLIFHVFISRN